MNKLKPLYLIALLFVFGACSDKLAERVSLDVDVLANESNGVKVEGNVITVKKGTPLEFAFSGSANFLSFFSGEKGSKYENRNRTSLPLDNIKSSKIYFDLQCTWGAPKDVLRVLYSTDFPGIQYGNFEADLKLAEDFWHGGNLEEENSWIDLVDPVKFPTVAGGGNNSPWVYCESMDFSGLLRENVTIALRYEQQRADQNNPTYNFANFRIENILKDGEIVVVYASDFGFNALNTNYEYMLEQDELIEKDADKYFHNVKNPAYYMSPTSKAGLWNFVAKDIVLGKFTMGGGWKAVDHDNQMIYSWLISNPLNFAKCSPDVPEKIKDISIDFTKFSHTYEQAGVYEAVFVADNINCEHSSQLTRSYVIKVVNE